LIAKEVLKITDGRIQVNGVEGPPSYGHDNGDERHRMSGNAVDHGHRKRRSPSPVFRRAIDSSKDKRQYIWPSRAGGPAALHPAGAAQPVAGKYDDISTI